MKGFIPLASAAVMISALAGCGTEPAQQSDVAPEQSEVTAGAPPAMAETMPVADETPAASAPAAPNEEAVPAEKSRPKQEPAAKAAVGPRAKAEPAAPKPVEPDPDPHAGHDMDKM